MRIVNVSESVRRELMYSLPYKEVHDSASVLLLKPDDSDTFIVIKNRCNKNITSIKDFIVFDESACKPALAYEEGLNIYANKIMCAGGKIIVAGDFIDKGRAQRVLEVLGF